ncbi:hypothetical protein ACFQ9X_29165 [Catenulispora yoronensis]
MALPLMSAPAADATGRVYKGKIWQPRPVVKEAAVPLQGGLATKHSIPQSLPGYVAPTPVWPSAATATVNLAPATAAPVKALAAGAASDAAAD